MNERILELAIEARKYAETKPDIYQVAYDKKFAELIVRECASLFEDDLRPMGDFTERACRRAIKEHFGVE